MSDHEMAEAQLRDHEVPNGQQVRPDIDAACTPTPSDDEDMEHPTGMIQAAINRKTDPPA
jgi:hypothetical protein